MTGIGGRFGLEYSITHTTIRRKGRMTLYSVN